MISPDGIALKERILQKQRVSDLDDAPALARVCADETEAELRRRTAELTAFVETASIGLHWVGADGTILWANAAEMNLLGYASEEYIGCNITEFHADKATIENILACLHRGERLHNYEARLKCKDGSVKNVLIDSSVLWEDGKFVHTQCFTRDITEIKKAQLAVARAAEEQAILYRFTDCLHRAKSLKQVYNCGLQSILEALRCQRASILLYDDESVMRFVGSRGLSESYRKAVEGHTPWKRDAKNPKPIYVEDIDKADISDALKTTVKDEGIGALAFIPLVVDGQLIGKFMAYHNARHHFSDDETNLGLTIARQLAFGIAQKRHGEILERTVVERTAQLRDTVAELEAFSYSIAHDMRAPLRAMASFSRVLDQDFAEKLGDDGRNFTRRIAAAAERLDRLIQDVLDYSKISRGEMSLEPVDVEKLTRGIIDSYSYLQERGATIMVQSPMPQVTANPAALTQCLSNLLSNAVKFVAPGVRPMIRVWAEKLDEQVRIWVEDNGIGISEEGKKRIFSMFQRLNPASEFEGTGIGLTIVRKAVERMSGRLGVESTAGAGSRFWIELKAA